jgi:hypothetical protein
MRSISKFLILVFTFFCGSNLYAQAITASDSSLFNFWIGDWNLTWKNVDGTTGKGVNSIISTLDGKVIQENFRDVKGFKGTSISVLTPRTKLWKQAWADNQGGYFDFEGFVEGNKRGFTTQPKEVNGKTYVYRMVFYDITKDSFVWDWEGTTDGGKTWKLEWRINYKRVKKR